MVVGKNGWGEDKLLPVLEIFICGVAGKNLKEEYERDLEKGQCKAARSGRALHRGRHNWHRDPGIGCNELGGAIQLT